MSVLVPASIVRAGLLAAAVCGCAARVAPATSTPSPSPPRADATPVDAAQLLADADAALAAEEPARAVALFGRWLAQDVRDDDGLRRAWLGLAHAHEMLSDCAAALVAYAAYLERFPRAVDAAAVTARRGACEAELEQWEASAASYESVAAAPDLLPSTRIEALARQGYALFVLERFADADLVLRRADEVFEAAQAADTERFGTYYFVGMARFYRAAIIHHRFREVTIELPEKVMAERFERKIALVSDAQDAYNHTIKAKHMFWVSAAGFQLGHLFSELYDALMYAPVPTWLDARQRSIYYEELKKQLRPVVDKAVWVLDKNLQTARRLGYDSAFIERTEAKLDHLQAVLLSDEDLLGKPHPRLVARPGEPDEPPAVVGAPGAAPPQDDAAALAELPPADRKLFVPEPTAL